MTVPQYLCAGNPRVIQKSGYAIYQGKFAQSKLITLTGLSGLTKLILDDVFGTGSNQGCYQTSSNLAMKVQSPAEFNFNLNQMHLSERIKVSELIENYK